MVDNRYVIDDLQNLADASGVAASTLDHFMGHLPGWADDSHVGGLVSALLVLNRMQREAIGSCSMPKVTNEDHEVCDYAERTIVQVCGGMDQDPENWFTQRHRSGYILAITLLIDRIEDIREVLDHGGAA
jgi:hypothetical protein